MFKYLGDLAGRPSFALAFPHRLEPVRLPFLLESPDTFVFVVEFFPFLALILLESSSLKSSGFLNFYIKDIDCYILNIATKFY